MNISRIITIAKLNDIEIKLIESGGFCIIYKNKKYSLDNYSFQKLLIYNNSKRFEKENVPGAAYASLTIDSAVNDKNSQQPDTSDLYNISVGGTKC